MKITIHNIEHIAWAKRLIITWYIELAPSDPEHGNWEYLLPSCGYRNVCDEEWIVMEPNTQHPQHTDTIVAPGTNVFVWDYGGVKGLDPKDFDATHSYIVQIVAIDSGCNWIDPCVDDDGDYIYETPGGEIPIGQPGTEGSDDDLFNNCGEGWELLEDEFGCLYCSKLSTTTGGDGTTTPSGGGISVAEEGTRLWHPGGGWGGPFIARKRKPTRPGDLPPPPIFPNPPKRAWDTPVDTPPGGGLGGPVIPGGDGDNDGDGNGDSGDPPIFTGLSGGYDDHVVDIFNDDDGLSTDSLDDNGGEGDVIPEWIGSTYGGREADWLNIVTPVDGMNANFPADIVNYTAERAADLPSEQAGLSIDPKSVPSQSSNNTLNDVPGRDDSVGNPSKISNAITSSDNTISINGTNNISSKDAINPTNSSIKSSRSIRPKGIDLTFVESDPRKRKANDARQLILRGSQEYKGDSASSVRVGRSKEQAGRPRVRGAGEVTLIRNSVEFDSQYEIKLVASPVGVNRIFADCRLNILPRSEKTVRLRVYFSQDKIDHLIGETPLKASSDPRIVSTTAPLGAVRGGETAVVYAVVDDGENVLGRKAVSVVMPDAGSRVSSGSRITTASGRQGDPVSSLIRAQESITLYMDNSKGLLLNCYIPGQYIDYSMELGAYTSSRAGKDTSVKIYNASDVSYLSGTSTVVFSSEALVYDIPKGITVNRTKYSSVVYRSIAKPANFVIGDNTDIVIAVNRVSDTGSDYITTAAGPWVTIKEATISSPPTAIDSDGLITLTFTDLPLLNADFSVYESGGNSITPENITTYEFKSDLSGGGTVAMPVDQLPTYIGLAVYDSGSLFRRTIKWFKIG